jgi:hypothetical protein
MMARIRTAAEIRTVLRGKVFSGRTLRFVLGGGAVAADMEVGG